MLHKALHNKFINWWFWITSLSWWLLKGMYVTLVTQPGASAAAFYYSPFSRDVLTRKEQAHAGLADERHENINDF